MKRISTKTTAEAVLRELPSVLGAYVSEDLEGHPREVHLLVRAGPDPAGLARDVRGLLEERLGIPIDQRVISIAQLARDPEQDDATPEPFDHEPTEGPADAPAETRVEVSAEAPAEPALRREPGRRSSAGPVAATPDARPVFAGLESVVSGGQSRVTVRLDWQGRVVEGHAEAADTLPGRSRAAASATLGAARAAAHGAAVGFELDFASIVQALDGDYVLVSVLALSQRVGRRPLPLVGAHPVESDVESAAAFATLKAINRVLSLALKDS
jgi:hypothetical protein